MTRTSSVLLPHARAMRRAPTAPEQTLWRALKGGRLAGLKFRRQAPVGPFVVDLVCVSARLVVEVDGATHADPEADRARDRWLRSEGYRVLRVWNNEVMGNIEGVLGAIMAAATPSPCPLPQGGEGEQEPSPQRGARKQEPSPPWGRGQGEGVRVRTITPRRSPRPPAP